MEAKFLGVWWSLCERPGRGLYGVHFESALVYGSQTEKGSIKQKKVLEIPGRDRETDVL